MGRRPAAKTHLAAVWRRRVNAGLVEARLVEAGPPHGEPADLLAAHAHLVIDRADNWVGDRTAETFLFHLYNRAREDGKSLLLLSRTAPVRLDFALPDLASRLRAAPSCAIGAPDDLLLGAVLVKLFADRQIQVGEDVIRYAVTRLERSFAAARDLVARADGLALAEKRAISVPLLRQILQAPDPAGARS